LLIKLKSLADFVDIQYNIIKYPPLLMHIRGCPTIQCWSNLVQTVPLKCIKYKNKYCWEGEAVTWKLTKRREEVPEGSSYSQTKPLLNLFSCKSVSDLRDLLLLRFFSQNYFGEIFPKRNGKFFCEISAVTKFKWKIFFVHFSKLFI